MTLSALMYEPYLILSANQKFYLFHVPGSRFYIPAYMPIVPIALPPCAAIRSFYACRLQPLTHRCAQLMAGTLYFVSYTETQGAPGWGSGHCLRRRRQASTSPVVATEAFALMTFPLLCKHLFALYIFAPIIIY